MLNIRRGTAADAGLIAAQRSQMYQDNGFASAEELEPMVAAFAAWVRPRLDDRSYVAFLAEEAGEVVAGAGLWIMDFPPHWLDVRPERAYLLNFFTRSSHRGRGLAPTLLERTVEEARRRGVRVITLHASQFGRPIYERFGFLQSSEMMLQVVPDAC